jgi:hypothetical protein
MVLRGSNFRGLIKASACPHVFAFDLVLDEVIYATFANRSPKLARTKVVSVAKNGGHLTHVDADRRQNTISAKSTAGALVERSLVYKRAWAQHIRYAIWPGNARGRI